MKFLENPFRFLPLAGNGILALVELDIAYGSMFHAVKFSAFMLFLFCFLSFSAMTGYKYYSFHRDIFCGSCRQFGRFSFLSGRDFCFIRLCFLFLRIFFSFCWDNFCAFSGKFVRNFYSICRFFISHSDIFRFLEHFFCLFCVGTCRVFPVILIFHPGSFTFCGCRLSFFYRLFRHFSVLGVFFLPVLCRRLLCFFP
jgi:hypothetical protein